MTETATGMVHGRATLADRIEAWGGAMRGRRLPWCATAFGTGVGAYFALPAEPPDAAPLLLGLLCATLGWAAWSGRAGRGWPALVLLFTLAGLAAAQTRTMSVAGPVLEWRSYGPVEGRVIKVDRSASDKPRITLDRVRLDMDPARTPERVRLSLHGDDPWVPPIGARVMTTAHLAPPAGPTEPGGFDFQRHAWFLRLGAVGYTRVPVLLAAPESRAGPVARVRAALTDHLRTSMPGQGGAVAAAIVTGDRAALDPATVQALRDSNLAHLLAISGLHMGLLAGLVFWVVRASLSLWPHAALRWPVKGIAAAVALPVAFAYLHVSGMGVATQRAFVMTAVVLGAVLLGRRALTLRGVALAALIVLALMPEALTGPGFQMSFAATAALVLAFRALGRRGPRWAGPVIGLVVASAVAGAATGPFAAAHFNRMVPWGLVANLAAVPAMGLLVMPALLAGLILSPVGLEAIPFALAEWGIAWIAGVAATVADWPGAVRPVPAPGAWVLPLLGFGAAAFACAGGARRGAGAAIFAAGLALWAQAERPPVLVSADGRLIGWMGPEGRALSKPKGAGFAAARWLEDDGDVADQPAAAMRGSPLARSVASVPKDAEVPCDGTLWVQPLPEGARPPCPVIDADLLAKGGALALWPDGAGWRTVTTREVQGRRPWVPR
ncbi:ComEC/Rec2 family competence protein [Jannaschia sp. Os4]|uniref:ComEC/Rec2 family competence protein n=1 Tax=Jannaschia sp. Os4 TaxID=2807617 RepID=UPI00193A72B6|nr:ComEC/Rec2 family competence protein [Jannaschia sp. Os4]MBM2577016.1 ComEC/Rec2 family competence protein [Jannaschia sp. Os4]